MRKTRLCDTKIQINLILDHDVTWSCFRLFSHYRLIYLSHKDLLHFCQLGVPHWENVKDVTV